MVNIKAILGITSVGLMLYTMYEQNNKINNLKSEVTALKRTIEKIDSAASTQYDELFFKQNEVGRYELSLEYLKDINPKAAKQFEDYMSHETE